MHNANQTHAHNPRPKIGRLGQRTALCDPASNRLAPIPDRDRQQPPHSNRTAEMVYSYLTGPLFRHHIGAIIETFADMQADLDRERRTPMLAKRDAQLNAVINASASFYGDLQGIAGQAMPELNSLDLSMIEDKTSTNVALKPSNGRSTE
jgi:hypothetical protein